MQHASHRPSPHQVQGLTLIELIISLTILLILTAIGIPGMQTLRAKNQQTTQINMYVTHFALARSLAITREQHQVICPSLNGESCLDQTDWSEGLIIFEDSDRNGERDADEPLHAWHQPITPSEIKIHSTNGRKLVRYHANGRQTGCNLTITFCEPNDRIAPKAVIVSNMGRVRVSDKSPDGSPLKCSM
ncbi:MAG: GspH/FimT family pseudopilin [Candidatus Thiodiazotropha sp.]|jgi:type IV fimbrial biogenesis protein FimT